MNQEENNSKFLMVVKTLHGLEDVLVQELENIGAERIKKNQRAVIFYGNKRLLYKSNLCLRTALRILKPISKFKANNEYGLYKKVSQINWENHMSLNETFLIDTTISQSNFFNHTRYVSQKIKDAIVDQFREKYGRRPSVNRYTPKIRINAYIKDEEITLSMDSSGDSLHKRGYRVQKGEAPINEVLAAGIVLLSNWKKNTVLKDPMCGSGTILIEAGMIAKNKAPNLNRKKFGFMFWKDFEEKLFQNIKDDLLKQEIKVSQKIEGADYHFAAISASRNNISYLNFSEIIDLKRFNFFHQKKQHDKRHIIFNPPYGERLEILEPDFYFKMGNIFKKYYEGSVVWMITSDFNNAKLIGLKPSKKIQLFNGPLECQLLQYELYPGSKKESKSPKK